MILLTGKFFKKSKKGENLMLEILRTVLPSPEQIEFAIEGMRNPMNSWNKSDSDYESGNICDYCFIVGDNDLDLMQRLSDAGTEHRKYLRMLQVGVRVNAPMYWYKEFDTYKVGMVRNSCSTMHKIHSKEFTLEDFSIDCIGLSDIKDNTYVDGECRLIDWVLDTIDKLEQLRLKYLDTKDKKYWYAMIQLLPSSYNQISNITLNYEVLANIYRQRRNHKLDEWHTFCDWIETLPYSELITGKGERCNE